MKESYFGLGIGGVVAVFLFRIIAQKPTIDEWLWVVVGDLPPAYLVTDVSPTPQRALKTYVREMRKWTKAVNRGESIDDLIPVNVEPSYDNAKRLRWRLDFIEKEILPVHAAG